MQSILIGHGQGLLGQDSADLTGVAFADPVNHAALQIRRQGDVDHLDRRIGEQFFIVLVYFIYAVALGRLLGP